MKVSIIAKRPLARLADPSSLPLTYSPALGGWNVSLRCGHLGADAGDLGTLQCRDQVLRALDPAVRQAGGISHADQILPAPFQRVGNLKRPKPAATRDAAAARG